MSRSADLVRVLTINMQSDMKMMRYMLTALASALLLSCSGNVDTDSLPVLEVSDTEIDLASETLAVFTVTYNGVDVTSEATIYSVQSTLELQGNVFTPEREGQAVFFAEYNGLESNQVTVNVINTDVKVESRYDRHVFIAEFTGASCAFCPAGMNRITEQFARPALARYVENAHMAAFHSEEMGIDTLAIPATMEIKGMFGGLDLPSYAIDLRDSGGLTSDGMSGFVSALKASYEEHTPHCGVAVSSAVDGDKAEVQVKVTSELSSEYRVIVLVVQDGIVGYQKHGELGELDDYTHKHVVRQVVTANVGKGEKITDDGRIEAGQEASKSWTVDIDGKWVLEKTEVYALALDKYGYVNNMNVCAIDGGDSGYDLK